MQSILRRLKRWRTPDEPSTDPAATEHLDDIGDGCGCVEIWEHLSDRRSGDGDGTS